MATHDTSALERIFLWQGDTRILLAITKYIEDKQNVAYDTGVAGVQVILLIEDNIRYYSSFLPTMYTEIINHSQSLITEGINASHKILRMRARPEDPPLHQLRRGLGVLHPLQGGRAGGHLRHRVPPGRQAGPAGRRRVRPQGAVRLPRHPGAAPVQPSRQRGRGPGGRRGLPAQRLPHIARGPAPVHRQELRLRRFHLPPARRDRGRPGQKPRGTASSCCARSLWSPSPFTPSATTSPAG